MDMIGSFGSFSTNRFSSGNIGNIEGEPLWTTAFRRGGLVKGTQGALFKGLRVRMGIHTGPVPRGYGQQPDGSLVYGVRREVLKTAISLGFRPFPPIKWIFSFQGRRERDGGWERGLLHRGMLQPPQPPPPGRGRVVGSGFPAQRL